MESKFLKKHVNYWEINRDWPKNSEKLENIAQITTAKHAMAKTTLAAFNIFPQKSKLWYIRVKSDTI